MIDNSNIIILLAGSQSRAPGTVAELFRLRRQPWLSTMHFYIRIVCISPLLHQPSF